jgi:septum site-determining protein MinD
MLKSLKENEGTHKLSKAIVVTSGKGGVGKTTVSANIAASLALLNYRVAAVDADIGLRNLDVAFGVEKDFVYN